MIPLSHFSFFFFLQSLLNYVFLNYISFGFKIFLNAHTHVYCDMQYIVTPQCQDMWIPSPNLGGREEKREREREHERERVRVRLADRMQWERVFPEACAGKGHSCLIVLSLPGEVQSHGEGRLHCFIVSSPTKDIHFTGLFPGTSAWIAVRPFAKADTHSVLILWHLVFRDSSVKEVTNRGREIRRPFPSSVFTLLKHCSTTETLRRTKQFFCGVKQSLLV